MKLNGFIFPFRFKLRLFLNRQSFLPKRSSFSLIKALFTLFAGGIYLKPLDNKEGSALNKVLVDKLMTSGLRNSPLMYDFSNILSALLSQALLSFSSWQSDCYPAIQYNLVQRFIQSVLNVYIVQIRNKTSNKISHSLLRYQ